MSEYSAKPPVRPSASGTSPLTDSRSWYDTDWPAPSENAAKVAPSPAAPASVFHFPVVLSYAWTVIRPE